MGVISTIVTVFSIITLVVIIGLGLKNYLEVVIHQYLYESIYKN